MGINLSSWGIRIGYFGSNIKKGFSSAHLSPSFGGFIRPACFGLTQLTISCSVLIILLLITGVEPNPGPPGPTPLCSTLACWPLPRLQPSSILLTEVQPTPCDGRCFLHAQCMSSRSQLHINLLYAILHRLISNEATFNVINYLNFFRGTVNDYHYQVSLYFDNKIYNTNFGDFLPLVAADAFVTRIKYCLSPTSTNSTIAIPDLLLPADRKQLPYIILFYSNDHCSGTRLLMVQECMSTVLSPLPFVTTTLPTSTSSLSIATLPQVNSSLLSTTLICTSISPHVNKSLSIISLSKTTSLNIVASSSLSSALFGTSSSSHITMTSLSSTTSLDTNTLSQKQHSFTMQFDSCEYLLLEDDQSWSFP